jgi:perosamine synthetase
LIFSKRQISLNRPVIGFRERRAVDQVLRSGMLAQGSKVAEFERRFSETVDSGDCVALNSGTSALHLGLLAIGIGPGDEVIVPSFTFAASANAIALTGATPIFVDIESEYFSVNPDAVEAAITPRTKAVVAVHLYGHPAQIDRLLAICERHSLKLVEDAAQAHLAGLNGKPVGSWGDVSAFSFYPTKNMTTGEGGMSVTGNPQVARTLRLLRNQGMERRYENEIVGFNNRMTEVAAAIGLVQLDRVSKWTKARQKNAEYLNAGISGVSTPKVAQGAEHVYHQYTILVGPGERSIYVEGLKRAGIASDVYYPTPVHRLAAYNQKLELPTTEDVAERCLSLPVHPRLRNSDLDRIIENVNLIARAGS